MTDDTGPTAWKWSHVPCASCGAEVGSPCVTAEGKTASAHTRRRAAWWEAAQRWKDKSR